ncbi:hypothetical protein FQN54_005296 [Arachnomyces sp. PD_36]|nr:hypothetical protein FQN54_005296 [Arachnomyces sp. PD_36]
MNRFYFGESDDDSGSNFDETESGLPFPKPLARSSFLTPDFDPAVYLSSLTNRHQTLEDLRVELRDLSQSLNKELLDLVNENYQSFLSLGPALEGGEEKVEEVKVGLLAFQRDVQAIRDSVEARRTEMKTLLDEKRKLKQGAAVGKALLDVAERIEELEQRLLIVEGSRAIKDGSGDSDDDSDTFIDSEEDESEEEEISNDTGATIVSLRKLESHIQKYLYVESMIKRIGEQHPFLVSQEGRMGKIKSTILLDLSTALNQADRSGEKRDGRMLAVMELYDLIGEETDAVNALKKMKI